MSFLRGKRKLYSQMIRIKISFSLKYDLPKTAVMARLANLKGNRLIWLVPGESISIEMKHYSNKYVGLVDMIRGCGFIKLKTGQMWKASALQDMQGEIHIDDMVTNSDQVVEIGQRLVKGRKMLLGSSKHTVNKSMALKLGVFSPQLARKEILKRGFMNQYQMGSSRGIFNPELRQKAEAHYLKMTLTEYRNLPVDVMPKYGMVLSPSFLTKSHKLSSQYGEDLYLLKFDQLRERLTWTYGSPVEFWDTRGFIPWEHKEPRSSHSVKYHTQFQVWGSVQPSDIQALIFTKIPPDYETIQMLEQNNIEVYDGRKGCPVKPYSFSEHAA